MPPAGFDPAIPGSKRQQNRTLLHATTGIGTTAFAFQKFYFLATQ